MKTKGGLFLIFAMYAVTVSSPTMADELKDELVAKEKASWEAWANGNGDAFQEILAEDATYAVAGEGITVGRNAIIDGIRANNCQIDDLSFSDFSLRQLTADIALLTYSASSNTTCNGQKLPSSVYATSIWIRQDGQWRTTSYQETALD
jgi:uncharacterized protein (TIGR02246 family)